MLRVAVTGGRDYVVTELQAKKFGDLLNLILCRDHGFTFGDVILFEGGARGVDAWAREWGSRHNVPVATISVNTDIDGAWPAAGPRRSRRMLSLGRVHTLIAFPGGRGTSSCTEIAMELDINVYVWSNAAKDFVLYVE